MAAEWLGLMLGGIVALGFFAMVAIGARMQRDKTRYVETPKRDDWK